MSSQCCEGGIISPTSCVYITKWLAVPDDHSTNENYTWWHDAAVYDMWLSICRSKTPYFFVHIVTVTTRTLHDEYFWNRFECRKTSTRSITSGVSTGERRHGCHRLRGESDLTLIIMSPIMREGEWHGSEYDKMQRFPNTSWLLSVAKIRRGAVTTRVMVWNYLLSFDASWRHSCCACKTSDPVSLQLWLLGPNLSWLWVSKYGRLEGTT